MLCEGMNDDECLDLAPAAQVAMKRGDFTLVVNEAIGARCGSRKASFQTLRFICVLILLYVSSYCYICVFILLYMCLHTAKYVSAYCHICVLILLYMCRYI